MTQVILSGNSFQAISSRPFFQAVLSGRSSGRIVKWQSAFKVQSRVFRPSPQPPGAIAYRRDARLAKPLEAGTAG